MNAGRITWFATVALLSSALGGLVTEQYVTAKLAPMSEQQRAYVADLTQKNSTCQTALGLITSHQTVLYEEVPAGVDVLSGFAHIEAGRALNGTPLAPRQPRWVLPFLLKPEAIGVPGAAYAYIDRQGNLSRLMEAPAAKQGQQ